MPSAKMTPSPKTHVVKGPGADLVHPIPGGQGIALVYAEALRSHESLFQALPAFKALTQAVSIPELAKPTEIDLPSGRILFTTEATVSLAEILAFARQRQQPCGVGTAFLLMHRVAEALDTITRASPSSEIRAHGNLNPWRIALRTDGTVVILGYGLPDVDLFAYLDSSRADVSLDTLRYAPPERLEDLPEDIRSDLYTLALIGAEMILNRPVFDGPPPDVVEKILRGDAPELIEALGANLEDPILDLLCVASEQQTAHRFRDAQEFIRQAKPLRGSDEDLLLLIRATLGHRPSIVENPTVVLSDMLSLEETMVVSRNEFADEITVTTSPSTDDTVTEEGLQGDFELAAAIPSIPHNPTLAEVQVCAHAVVARTEHLAEQADAMLMIGKQRANGMPQLSSLVRRLKDAVAKTKKASASTANTAKLVELDDRVDDALMTLDMVRSTENLCVSSAQTALSNLYKLQAEIDDLRAEQQQLEQAVRLANQSAKRASVAAKDATAAANELERALQSGHYTVPGSRALVQKARKYATDATAAAVRARSAETTIKRAPGAATAHRESSQGKLAAEAAESALGAIQKVTAEINEAEQRAMEVIAARLRTFVARSGSAALQAEQCVERARTATTNSHSSALIVQLAGIERHQQAARRAATECAELVNSALTSDQPHHPRRLREAQRSADELARAAEQQAAEAGDLSDSVVALAGEAASRAAKISKLQSEIEALFTRIRTRHQETEAAYSSLTEDTKDVTGVTARDAIHVADNSWAKLQKVIQIALESEPQYRECTDVPQSEQSVHSLREITNHIDELSTRCLSRTREARGAAARELKEIAERREREQELQRAIERARGHAERCTQSVRAAWEMYQQTVEILASAAVEAADDLRVRAYEIIDIAEFQAGEAEVAAKAAADQTDAAEANSHASAAASFEERISEDLPEAIELLQRAANQATEEIGRLNHAREQIRTALNAATDAHKALESHLATAREEAAEWPEHKGIQDSLHRIEVLAAGHEEVLSEARYAARRADQTEDADAAHEMVPLAEGASKKLVDAEHAAQEHSATLQAAVANARQRLEAHDSAVVSITAAVAAIAEARIRIGERAQRLFTAIEDEAAEGDSVAQSARRMRDAMTRATDAHNAVLSIEQSIHSASSEPATLQAQAQDQLRRVEELLDTAAQAETEGVRAAQREASERVEASERQLRAARSAALVHVGTAKHAAERGVALLRTASVELSGETSPEVRSLHRRARELIRTARTATSGALQAARKCQRAREPGPASEWEARAETLAQDATNAVTEAHSVIRDAVDLARRTEADAEALKKIKAEISSIRTMLAEGTSAAESDLQKIQQITDVSQDPLTVECITEARSLYKAIERSAAKFETAAPLATEADRVEVAQRLLDTCRKAQERVDQDADSLRELTHRAKKLQGEEAARAEQRLQEAKHAAQAPAIEAKTLAEKTLEWLDSGKRLASSSPSPEIDDALQHLIRCAEIVEKFSTETAEIANSSATATRLSDVHEVRDRAIATAALTEKASQKAHAALDRVKRTISKNEEQTKEIQGVIARAVGAAAATEALATTATSIVENVERRIADANLTDDVLTEAFREVKRTAKQIGVIGATAFQSTQDLDAITDLRSVYADAELILASREQAQELLTQLKAQQQGILDTIDNMKRQSREEARRSKDEALRAKLRRRRTESTAMKREDLKKRLRTPAAPDKPNLSVLRERLRARRRGERTAGSAPAARPRQSIPGPRTTPRPKRRRPDASSMLMPAPEPESEVPLEPIEESAPRARSAEERKRSRSRREQRRREISPPTPTPTPPARSGSKNDANALLQRLRKRRGGK